MTPDDGITLREYLTSLINSVKEANERRWDGHEHYHETIEEARKLAAREIDRRLEDMNQFREQIDKERGDFVIAETFDGRVREIVLKQEAGNIEVEKRIAIVELWKSNLDGRFWMLGAVISILTVLINVLFKWVFK